MGYVPTVHDPDAGHVPHGRTEPHTVALDLPELATVVVARCADDVIELSGGLIALQRARGVEVTVLSPDGSDPDGCSHLRHDPALSILGVETVTDLGFTRPDDVAALADAIAAVEHCGLIVAPWTPDGRNATHGDEAAVRHAAEQAAAHCGAALLFAVHKKAAEAQPAALRGERLVRLELDQHAKDRRRRALTLSTGNDLASTDPSPEFFLTASWPIARGGAPTRAPGLTTGVPPVTAGRSGVET